MIMSECLSSLFCFFFYGVSDDYNADDVLPCLTDILPWAVTATVGLLENEIYELVIEAGITKSYLEID